MNESKRVVVTGMGIISCLGNNLDDVSRSLQQGIPGYEIDEERIQLGFRSPLTGKIKNFETKEYLNRKRRKTMSESTIWAYAASQQAIDDAGISSELLKRDETGIIFGHDSCAKPVVEMTDLLREEKKTMSLGSGYIFQIMDSTVTMNLSTIFQTKGACWSIAGACASSAHSIGQALNLIRQGEQEIIIAGGAQEINWQVMASFDALQAFSLNIENPQKASRPFDRDRDGLIPSGGAAAIILERMDLAKKRGVKIYAEIIDYAFSSDGEDISIPNGEGAKLCMQKLLKKTDLNQSEIRYINAHATSTPGGDKKEAWAIKQIFGKNSYVSSTKSMTGHECWMAGAGEAIYSILMMRDSFIAPNINFENPDEDTEKIKIAASALSFEHSYILSNSFGFGGTNASLLFRKL